jgi:hypothetical protein
MTKYGAKKTTCFYGNIHASGMEARRCNDLHILWCTGEITELHIV